jgi:hypothetical protein
MLGKILFIFFKIFQGKITAVVSRNSSTGNCMSIGFRVYSFQWEPMLPDFRPPLLHSHSVVDIFQSVSQSATFLISLDCELEKNLERFLNRVTESLIF